MSARFGCSAGATQDSLDKKPLNCHCSEVQWRKVYCAAWAVSGRNLGSFLLNAGVVFRILHSDRPTAFSRQCPKSPCQKLRPLASRCADTE